MQGDYDPQKVKDFLKMHLKRMESTRNHILKEFYEDHNEDRDKFQSIFHQYINHIMNFMDDDMDVAKSEQWPFVLVGSIVEVEDLDYNNTDQLKIVPPFYEDKTTKVECASCLSPVGHALLLKKIGDKIEVKTPLGDCNFVIKSIDPPLN